jgi:hypothetical protein
MKIVVLIVKLLLGLVFFVFGLNAFLQFLKGPMPRGLAGQFLQALFQSHYVLAIGAVQAVGGALLLLTILGPVIVNILLYPSAAQSRRHLGRADRGGVLVCVALPLSPVLFRDLYRKTFVCVVQRTLAGFAVRLHEPPPDHARVDTLFIRRCDGFLSAALRSFLRCVDHDVAGAQKGGYKLEWDGRGSIRRSTQSVHG